MSDKDRIENAIRHIQTATDIDPWAVEIAVKAMQSMVYADDDLISRQAAIDAIFSEPLYKSGMKKRDADVVVPAIYEKIKSLPSAQPSDSKIENAIRVLQTKYSKALSLDFIHNPVAWALYKTWKEFDK